MQSETNDPKTTAASLAKLIDEAGDCDWQRFRRYSGENYYAGKLIIAGVVLIPVIAIFTCLGFGPIVGLLIFASAAALPFYVWQRWIMLRGELEDAMLLASEDEIATAISMAKWEDIGFDSAARVKNQGRPELKSFEVLRKFEPENVKSAHSAMKNAAVSKKLHEVHESHRRIEDSCTVWATFAAILAGVVEYFIIVYYSPTFFTDGLSKTEQLVLLPPLLVGAAVHVTLWQMWDGELKRLKGVKKRHLSGIKRQEKKRKKQKPGDKAPTQKPPEHRNG